MKILLTGGAGYIGSHTAVELIAKGHTVVIADNYANSSPVVIDRIEELSGVRPAVYTLDVADKAAMDAMFRKEAFEAVIHFAGFKAVGESVEKPVEYYRNNLDTTLTLLETMKKYGVKKLVFSSSATVYGVPDVVPLCEDMPTKGCTNPYGWTKYMIEQILRDTAKADDTLSILLLRYFNPVGAHKSGRIGEDPQGIPNNLMPFISQVAVGRLKELSIFGNDYPTPDGTGVRDYLHVVDLANGHVAAIDFAIEHTGTSVFNLGTGRGTSVTEMVEAFEHVNGVKIARHFAPRRPGDLAEVYADPKKSERELHWKATHTLEDMCRDTWNWQKNNPNGYKN